MNRKKITLLRYRSRYFIFKTDVIEFKPLDWKRGEILQLNLTNLARFGKMPGPGKIFFRVHFALENVREPSRSLV